MLTGVQRGFGAECEIGLLAPIALADLARTFAREPEGFRIQFLYGLCVLAAINTAVRVESVEAI